MNAGMPPPTQAGANEIGQWRSLKESLPGPDLVDGRDAADSMLAYAIALDRPSRGWTLLSRFHHDLAPARQPLCGFSTWMQPITAFCTNRREAVYEGVEIRYMGLVGQSVLY